MRSLAALTLALLMGCAARQPATAHASSSVQVPEMRLVAPPDCVKLTAPLLLDKQGHAVRKQPVKVQILCSEVQPVKKK